MDDKIKSIFTLRNLVDLDSQDHKLKDIAELFLNSMRDWPTYNQTDITDFIKELKKYFGAPLTIERITLKQFGGENAWQVESGGSIADLIDLSTKFCNEPDFDKIVENFLAYYEQEFRSVDFIAELKYFSSEKGGGKTPVNSGYKPALKFDFMKMQTSGQQIFIGKETVLPGETVEAKIKIASPDLCADNLTVGMKFEFREGPTTIGTGIIKKIINDRLEKASG